MPISRWWYKRWGRQWIYCRKQLRQLNDDDNVVLTTRYTFTKRKYNLPDSLHNQHIFTKHATDGHYYSLIQIGFGKIPNVAHTTNNNSPKPTLDLDAGVNNFTPISGRHFYISLFPMSFNVPDTFILFKIGSRRHYLYAIYDRMRQWLQLRWEVNLSHPISVRRAFLLWLVMSTAYGDSVWMGQYVTSIGCRMLEASDEGRSADCYWTFINIGKGKIKGEVVRKESEMEWLNSQWNTIWWYCKTR